MAAAVVAGVALSGAVPANAFTLAVDDAYELGAEGAFTAPPGGMLANDEEVSFPGAYLHIETPPQHGTLSKVDDAGNFTYTPAPGFFGTDTFVYCVKVPASPNSCTAGPATVSLTVKPHLERIGAADRFAEAAAIATSRFAPDVASLYLASGSVFADALSAGSLGSPILLATRDSIPDATQAALTQLRPKKIIVLGGYNTLSSGVEQALSVYSGSVVRLGGADRFAVSAAVSQFTFPPVRPVYVASGEVFPDALSASAAAGAFGAPVLLVQKNAVPDAIGAELARLKPTRIEVLGGTSTISDDVIEALQKIAPTTRTAGADRYAVAAGASAAVFNPMITHVIYIASGEVYPDALSGSPAAISQHSPVLLVGKSQIPAATAAELTRLHPTRIVVLGGLNTISQQVEDGLKTYLAK
ncbi:cell wall-binding repeat-containing protein [Herbiconiux sp. YIM B11900]|uniref:cell wall-binding repeat-containing protein n=1 Tax=Herbiconiux sp. YIM B11900 TaxID=3404131 RepID=UPI003F84EE43